MATFDEYIEKLKTGIYKPVIRVEFLRRDETIEHVITVDSDVVDGSISITRNNGVRRSCGVTFPIITQADKEFFIPNRYGVWIGRKFKIFLGIEVSEGDDFLIPQGVFVMTNPSIVSIGGSTIITLNGVDKFSLLNGQNGGYLLDIVEIPDNSNVNTALTQIIQTPNKVYTDPTSPDLQGVSTITPILTTTYTQRREAGEPLSELMKELSWNLSRNIFYDENGRLRCQDDFSDDIKGSLWDFNFNDDRYSYLGSTSDFKFDKLKNTVKVIGANVNGNIATGIARDNNPLSPTNVEAIGEIIHVVYNDIYQTDADAQKFAEYILKRLNAINRSVSITAMPMYHLDVDQVITLTDSKINYSRDRFLVTAITLPLSPSGTMSVSCVKTDDIDIGGQF